MSKRLGAALGALLTFATVLAVVPLVSAEPADAHTKTKRSCYYHPIQGLNCWNAPVKHSHDPPPDIAPYLPRDTTTTTAAPPPTTTTTEPPKCPAGQSGTPPNCVKDVCPAGQRGTPPNCVPDVCPAGQTGTPPNCVPDVCPAGQTGTPPNCVPDVCPAGQTGTPPNCVAEPPPPDCLPVTRGRGVRHQHKHALGIGSAATTSACHPVNDSHCPTGEHEHAHGSQQCHTLGQKVDNSDGDHKGWTDHCPSGEHSHEHSGDCHPEKQQAWRFPQACRGSDPGVRYHNHGQGLGCHPVGVDLCPAGQHEHKPGVYRNVRGCHDEDAQHGSGELQQSEGYLYDAAGVIVCYGAGVGGAAAAAKLILKGISWLGAAIAGAPGGIGAGQGCEALFDWLEEAERNKREQEKRDHDDDSSDDDSSDSPTPTTAPPPPPTTTAPPFNHGQCHAWVPSLRMCYRLENGVPRITYH